MATYNYVGIVAGHGDGTSEGFYYNPADGKFYRTNGPWFPLDSLTPPTRAGKAFLGYFSAQSGGTPYVTKHGEFMSTLKPSSLITIYSQWMDVSAPVEPDLSGFASVHDWFCLASDALVPVRSSSGEQKRRTAASNGGRYSPDAATASGRWRNPSVVYNIVADTTIALTLGMAFPAGFIDNAMVHSGYMIVSAVVASIVGRLPTLTVSAVANEGADAINLFPVEIEVTAQPTAQNLMSAFSDANLVSCSMAAVCDPVVCEEDGMPCASDVVNGRLEASAESIFLFGQNAPSAANGFVLLDDNTGGQSTAFTRHSLKARKELA